ncbi:helix-turn-helix domain-containing protein [Microbacterium sp. lyk4-40-TSB-66]|jgi:DNA-binding HxlR family transcriptional regulator|uniref:winged helix-turn-helix transcriptional regulator n=1 Tax=Microbacterium sp. lyk4-40-TSB-66 TaxID=3040294 RepID=UPI00254ACF33|nr:helix-turn-helix domain-containing protein [Microbacterium sp. lyk4-40-TSB-66]
MATTARIVSGPCRAWPEESAFIREVLDRIGDKWTTLVISTLATGPLRYSDLQASIPGISQRMLTVTLKALERDGLLTRTAFAEVPPRVVYELTDLGRSLQDAVLSMARWAATNHQAVAASRLAHERTGVGRVKSHGSTAADG